MSKTYPQYVDTTYPDAVQTLEKYLDISNEDLVAYNTYIQYIYKGDFDNAQLALQKIPNFEKKTITAFKLNQLVDTIMALQTLYQSPEFQAQVQKYQSSWMDFILQFSYVGQWDILDYWSSTYSYKVKDKVIFNDKIWECLNPNTGDRPDTNFDSWKQVYKKNTIVSYKDNTIGEDNTEYLYIANKDISNNIPPNKSTEWVKITKRGVRGEAGVGMVFRFEWTSVDSYEKDNLITYENTWWRCKVANTNQEPVKGSEYWESVLEVYPIQIPIQKTQPLDNEQNINDLWFQLI